VFTVSDSKENPSINNLPVQDTYVFVIYTAEENEILFKEVILSDKYPIEHLENEVEIVPFFSHGLPYSSLSHNEVIVLYKQNADGEVNIHSVHLEIQNNMELDQHFVKSVKFTKVEATVKRRKNI
jgi:hypothetical protein